MVMFFRLSRVVRLWVCVLLIRNEIMVVFFGVWLMMCRLLMWCSFLVKCVSSLVLCVFMLFWLSCCR